MRALMRSTMDKLTMKQPLCVTWRDLETGDEHQTFGGSLKELSDRLEEQGYKRSWMRVVDENGVTVGWVKADAYHP